MLILVRHGETAANARGLVLGRADPPLTDAGCRQARALARVLPGPCRVVSSPLRRARQTADLLAAGAGGHAGRITVQVDPRWIEMDYGDLDQRPVAEVPETVWQAWRRDSGFVPAGGESVAAVGVRVRQACLALAGEAARGDVVVVSHVSPIKAAVAWALGVDDVVVWRMFLADAAICRIDTSGPSPVLLSFNEPCPAAPAESRRSHRAGGVPAAAPPRAAC